jgi:RHS repeat-associated protein
LIEEYQGATTTAAYVYGASGLIAGALNGQVYYYYQDGSGSTSHLADSNGVLKEWYRYDLQGAPIIYDANDNELSTSNYGVRHLFTGQQWYKDVGLYDLRNRFYSPDIGRFLQPDPVGFWGDRTNLYRYCGNNPVTQWDPFGLVVVTAPELGGPPRGAPGAGFPPSLFTGGPGGGSPGGAGPGGGGRGDRGNKGSKGTEVHVYYDGMTPEEYDAWAQSYTGPFGDQGPNVTVSATPLQRSLPGGLFFGASPSGNNLIGNYRLVVDPRKIIVPVTRQFAGYNLKSFANVMDYGMAYPAAAAVAAPVAGYLGLGGWNAYLSNPVFWNGAAGAAVPGLLGYGNPMEVPQSKGEWAGQGIVWIWDGTKWIASRPAKDSPGRP